MITNGIELRRIDNLGDLTWLRISLNLDQERGRKLGNALDNVDIPGDVTFGFSSVFMGDEELFWESVDFAKKYNPKYIRVLVDAFGHNGKREILEPRLKDLVAATGDERVFFITRITEAPDACYIGYLKPFLYADGYVYPCSSCVLGEGKFPDRFRMYHVSEIREFYETTAMESIVEKGCWFCVPHKQNNFLTAIREPVDHRSFV